MASFQTLVIILLGLVLIASLLYNASKSKNPIKRARPESPPFQYSKHYYADNNPENLSQ